MPPPSASPEIPTLGQEPPGTSTPRWASALYMSISRVPAPTVAREPDTVTPPRLATSITRPLPVEYPA
jgi:hypothetical protein